MCGKELEEERNKKMKGRIEGLGLVKEKNGEKMAGGRKRKKEKEKARGEVLGLGLLKKKEKREKEREKVNLIREERETNLYIYCVW